MKCVIPTSPATADLAFAEHAEHTVDKYFDGKDCAVVVDVAATAVNRADCLQRKGGYPPPPGESNVLGLECAGTVARVGKAVKGVAVGDRVCALLASGGYAEQAVVYDARHLIPVPKDWCWAQAAATPEVWLTAFQALRFIGGLSKGQTVLMHAGASGVGTAGIQIARAVGAVPIVTVGSAEKVEYCTKLGAELAINYKETEDWTKAVLDHTGGKGVNLLIDFVGGPRLGPNINALAVEGKMVVLGLLGTGKVPEGTDIGPILRKRLTITGSTLRARSADYKAELVREFVAFATPHFASGALKPIVFKEMPIEEVGKAHELVESNTTIGKVVMIVNPKL